MIELPHSAELVSAEAANRQLPRQATSTYDPTGLVPVEARHRSQKLALKFYLATGPQRLAPSEWNSRDQPETPARRTSRVMSDHRLEFFVGIHQDRGSKFRRVEGDIESVFRHTATRGRIGRSRARYLDGASREDRAEVCRHLRLDAVRRPGGLFRLKLAPLPVA